MEDSGQKGEQKMGETISTNQLNDFLLQLHHLSDRIVKLSNQSSLMNLKQKANLIKAEKNAEELRIRVEYLENELKLSKLREIEAETDAADMDTILQEEKKKLAEVTEQFMTVKKVMR